MKLEFKSGRSMPLSHVFKWSLSQIGILIFFICPFWFLDYFLIKNAF
jgi:hypothetical protein